MSRQPHQTHRKHVIEVAALAYVLAAVPQALATWTTSYVWPPTSAPAANQGVYWNNTASTSGIVSYQGGALNSVVGSLTLTAGQWYMLVASGSFYDGDLGYDFDAICSYGGTPASACNLGTGYGMVSSTFNVGCGSGKTTPIDFWTNGNACPAAYDQPSTSYTVYVKPSVNTAIDFSFANTNTNNLRYSSCTVSSPAPAHVFFAFRMQLTIEVFSLVTAPVTTITTTLPASTVTQTSMTMSTTTTVSLITATTVSVSTYTRPASTTTIVFTSTAVSLTVSSLVSTYTPLTVVSISTSTYTQPAVTSTTTLPASVSMSTVTITQPAPAASTAVVRVTEPASIVTVTQSAPAASTAVVMVTEPASTVTVTQSAPAASTAVVMVTEPASTVTFSSVAIQTLVTTTTNFFTSTVTSKSTATMYAMAGGFGKIVSAVAANATEALAQIVPHFG
ncbi:hypothetical protein HKX48_001590 [Thoreauomyces humboldtii]|nr:hypothetical protein HKX48_001590 [Thoreauomyces humboldtii]